MATPAPDRLAGDNPGPWLAPVLRAGTAACFVGHGALGLLRTASWTSYFAVVGIGREHALALMPLVGLLDVALGLSVLVVPIRGVVFYMAAWGAWTAALRPLAGEPAWEAIERAGNYGAPLALALLVPACGCVDGSDTALTAGRRRAIFETLRLTTFLLLLGHGVLGLVVRKPLLAGQYAQLGLPGAAVTPLVGGVECLLALLVLVRPGPRLLFGVTVWKLASEALGPLAGASLWTFVEHGGSYAAPLALALLPAASARTQAVTAATSGSASPLRP